MDTVCDGVPWLGHWRVFFFNYLYKLLTVGEGAG